MLIILVFCIRLFFFCEILIDFFFNFSYFLYFYKIESVKGEDRKNKLLDSKLIQLMLCVEKQNHFFKNNEQINPNIYSE